MPAARRPAASEPSPPRKTNRLLVLGLASIPLLLICGVLVYLLASNALVRLLPSAPPEIPTAFIMPVQPATATAVSSAPAGTPTSLATAMPVVAYTPEFEPTDCRFGVPLGANVSCGFLIVPEDRTADASHTIRLAVAVYHSAAEQPAAEPVLFLQGGPGGEAVKLSGAAYGTLVEPFLDRQDFIAYDQRGTGLSEPALNCDELTKAYQQDIHGQIPASARKLVYSNAFLSCEGLLTATGIDLNAYTTVESAADVKDLLQVLGYSQADLYGASYGTRLAQAIMRDDPGIVRSAILDSVVPLETNFFIQYPKSAQGALRNLFDACLADRACNAAYPNLESVFWAEVQKLDDKPVTLTVANPTIGSVTQDVDGAVFLDIVLGSLKTSSLIYTVPQTIYRFKAGDYSTVLAAESSLPFAFNDISAGLFISMMCHEHILTTTPQQLDAATTGPQDIRDYAWQPFYGTAQDLYQTCKSWGSVGPRLGENDAVNSSIPALVITGKYDPTTPPVYAQQVAAHLSHSYYFEFADQGHTPTAADASGCAMKVALAFLADPSVEPGRSCLEQEAPVDFVLPYTGSPALELADSDSQGVTVEVPADWTELGDGFYLRGNSPFDVTEIGVLTVPGVRTSDLLNWISQKAWGYRGLDGAPIYDDQRQANGLDWTLYKASSYGRPVDLAMADSAGGSVLVLAFSNIDEHDAIYQTVFLPAVDSARP